MSPGLVGAVVGAVLGGLGRVALVIYHLGGVSSDIVAPLLAVAAIGIVVGGLAGMTGRPLLGAVVGAALSLLVHLGTLPVRLMMRALQVAGTASMAEVVVLGAVVGAIAGGVGRAAGNPGAGGRRRGSG